MSTTSETAVQADTLVQNVEHLQETITNCELEIANIVHVIKNNKLYEDIGCSWTDFANDKLGMSRSHADVLAHWARIRDTLSEEGFENLPNRRSQIKALRSLNDEALVDVWNSALTKVNKTSEITRSLLRNTHAELY